ncbi:aminotransferase class I/II-fold pyridoxal phosphate-dependent enzyme [Fructobacillus sp. M1-13]|uniref:Aminotransferase n=1 Tax=Fructobacillus papyriferae TaxID=2713171 RepID=A0ABS5QQ49_9LACO|nr:aminotransferase class I/II-fold pyridoxal phosphate-dependent enzyme [Fructobacillus papyriferae]MBS9334610.1 aminotransferase class I/II-fold pyridoxal phosphate-dependent enzyme [Fructobacillus papyriferae]MCD2158600.1 aminotransferase class I/II-fold pyridoxal phosphate-dependent enzyme [Fructobacillus papyriferae]
MVQHSRSLNPSVTEIPADKILGFQASIQSVPDMVYLTLGEPGFDAPNVVKEATVQGIRANHSHYGNSQGNPELRQAVIDYLADRYRLTTYKDPNQVVITAGVSEAMYAIFKTVLSSGDGILVPDPAYGSYFSSIALADGKALPIDTSLSGFKLTPEAIHKAVKAASVPVKAVLFNYPNNPTGVTYSYEELSALAQAFEEEQLWVISDEIYSELTYGKAHFSIGQLIPDQTLVVNGLSKSHAMTGYRVGFILAPQVVADQLKKVHASLIYSIPTFVYDGALAALKMQKEELNDMIKSYEARRNMAVDALKEAGFHVLSPDGAFYLFAKLPVDIKEDGWTFAEKLAKEGHVGVIPGEAFSQFEGAKDYIRISYAGDQEQLKEGLERISDYIEKRRANR